MSERSKRLLLATAAAVAALATACYAVTGTQAPAIGERGGGKPPIVTGSPQIGLNGGGAGATDFGAAPPRAPFKGWVTGLEPTPPTASPVPKLNLPFVDPAYNTTITRVTDVSQITDDAAPAWIRHEYSRRPAFNVDSSRALMASSNGFLRLYEVDKPGNRLRFVKTLKVGGNIEPNWHPTDPNVFRHFGNSGAGMKIFEYDVTSDRESVVRDLSAAVRKLYPKAESLWTKEEGRPSKDGNVWCMMAERYDAAAKSVAHYGFVSYDFAKDRILGHYDTAERPDHISASPLGKYCVPSSDGKLGTVAFTVDFSKQVKLQPRSEHSDLGLGKDGKEVYVYSDYSDGPRGGKIWMVRLDDGAATELFSLYGPNHSSVAVHISGVAMDKPGYFVIDFDHCTENYNQAPCDPKKQWFYDKVVIVELTTPPKIYSLAHTHFGDAGYFGETQSVANRDLTKVLFVSSWERKNESDISDYMVDVPPLP